MRVFNVNAPIVFEWTSEDISYTDIVGGAEWVR